MRVSVDMLELLLNMSESPSACLFLLHCGVGVWCCWGDGSYRIGSEASLRTNAIDKLKNQRWTSANTNSNRALEAWPPLGHLSAVQGRGEYPR